MFITKIQDANNANVHISTHDIIFQVLPLFAALIVVIIISQPPTIVALLFTMVFYVLARQYFIPCSRLDAAVLLNTNAALTKYVCDYFFGTLGFPSSLNLSESYGRVSSERSEPFNQIQNSIAKLSDFIPGETG